ncbi:MAG TPA: hypothetical protein VNN19_03385 [bacterium]|nr:hypothetical protein [bacterium]
MLRSRLVVAAALVGALAVALSTAVGVRLRTSSSQVVRPVALGPLGGAGSAPPRAASDAEPEQGAPMIRVVGTLRIETIEDYAPGRPAR